MKNGKSKKSFIYGFTFNSVIATTVLLFIFCVVVSAIGYYKFTDSLTNEYTDSAYRTAETAATLVNAENISAYLDNGESILAREDTDLAKEYHQSLERLNILCNKQNVTIIYVIAVDTTDYENYISVFNCPNENSKYSPWLLGERKYTTKTDDDTYQNIYRDMYENGLDRATIMRTTNLNGAPPHVTSLIPLYKSDGTVAAIMCIQRPMSELVSGRRSYIIMVFTATALFAALITLVSAFYTRKQFVKPLQKIVGEAQRFAAENSVNAEGLPAKISKISEISSLASAISEMESETVDYMKRLTTATAEKERIGTELQVASRIQEDSVPSVFPAFPDRKEFDLYASMTPAREVGGDFYDFFLIDEDHLALVMADVSGKGVPAALFMMVTKILINERALTGGTPAEILEIVNRRICDHNAEEMFVTVWLGILEISSGKIVAANAGHDDPAVCRKGKTFECVKSKHGLVVGAFSAARYTDYEIHLEKGDKLFLYTDGLTESTDINGRMFKAEGMLSALNRNREKHPESLLKGVWREVEKFVGDAPQFDDLTMLCLEFGGQNPEKTATFKAADDNLGKATAFIREFLENAEFTERAILQTETAFEEIFVNVCHYAYPSGTGEVRLFATLGGDGNFVLKVEDDGVPYNPLNNKEPDITLSAKERKIGGLGVFMAKKLTDKMSYEYIDGKNVLTMEKKK